jgi:hypothetical protein
MSLLKLKSMAGIMPKNLVTQVVNFTPLMLNDCSAFWNSVQSNPTEATRVLTELLNKVVELEKSNKSNNSSSNNNSGGNSSSGSGNNKSSSNQSGSLNNKDLDRALWMLVYTARFIDLYFVVDSQDKLLRRALSNYEAHRQEHRAVTSTAIEADQLIRTLSRGSLEKQDTTNALVLECTMVISVESTLLAAEGQRDLSFSVLRDNSFVHTRLQAQILHGGESTRLVFDELVLQLEAQQKMIRARPVLTNSALGNVMAMLHTLKEAVRSFPLVDLVLLRRAANAVRGYMYWPLPYGTFAKHIYDLLEHEMRLPGSNLRERILTENPLLTGFGAQQTEKYGPHGVDWSRSHRIVAVMYNAFIPRSYTMRKMIARSISRSHQPYLNELTTTREEVLVSIMETLLVNKTNLSSWRSSLVQTLRNKHATDLSEWYNKAMAAISKTRIDIKELIAVLKSMSPSLVDGVEARYPATATTTTTTEIPLTGNSTEDSETNDAFFDHANSNNNTTSSVNKPQIIAGPSSTKDPTFWNHTVPRVPQLFFDFLEIAPTGEGIPMSRRTRTELGHGSFAGGDNGSVIGGASNEALFPHSGKKPSQTESRAGGGGTGSGGRRGSKNKGAKSRVSITIPGMDIFSTNPAFDNSDAIPGAFGFHKCPQRYVLYGADYDELLRDVRALSPPDQTEGNPLERTQALGRPKGILRRVIMGGHDVLHRAVSIYTALRAMEPELCTNVEFRFFLVPLGRNDLAGFLAQRDGWYRKNVYVPFHGPLLLLPLIKYTGADVIDLENDTLDLPPEGFLPKQTSNPATSSLGVSSNSASTGTGGGARHALSNAGGGYIKRPDSMGGGFGDGGDGGDDAIVTGVGDEGGGTPEGGGEDGLKDIGHRLDANPSKLLRHLLTSYVRGAEVAWPVTVFDCECWESPDAIEMERGPDLTIPFCVRVEIGLGAAIAEHTSTEDFTTNFVGEASNEGLGPDFSLSDILTDKSFVKAISGNPAITKLVTPELSISMFRMDVDGNLHAGHMRDIMELPDAAYLSLVIASTPRMTFPLSAANSTVAVESFEPPATAANPSSPSIEVQTVIARNNVVDLIKKKDKKDKDVDVIKEHLRIEARSHHVGLIDIRASNASRIPFNISVDGKAFGPYYRVRIRGSTALSKSGGQAMFSKAPHLALPIMTFIPMEAETEGGLDSGYNRDGGQRISVFSV